MKSLNPFSHIPTLIFSLLMGCATAPKIQSVGSTSVEKTDSAQAEISTSSKLQEETLSKLYPYPTTSPVDVTDLYQTLRSTSYVSVEELVSQIADPNKSRLLSDPDEEGSFSERVSHIQQEDGQATVFIERCCEMDDSVGGSRLTLQLIQKQQVWYLEKATRATLCYRGASESSCN